MKLLSAKFLLLYSAMLLIELSAPSGALAYPFCDFEISCERPSGGFAFTCSGAKGTTRSTYTGRFDYRVGDGDRYGTGRWPVSPLLATANSYRQDCVDAFISRKGIVYDAAMSAGYKQRRADTGWSSYLATTGGGIVVSISKSTYKFR